MADGDIRLPVDGAGKRLAAQSVTRGLDTVYREEIVVADPDTEGGVAAVSAANGLEVDVTRVQGTVDVVDGGGSLTVDDGGGSLTVDGTVAVSGVVNVGDGGSSISVDDNGASLTVDNPTLAVVGGGTEAAALRVTLANDSTGLVSVDDGGASLTVDGTVVVTDGGSTISIDDGGGSITVDGTVTVNEPVSIDDNGGSITVDGTVGVSGVVDVTPTVPAANDYLPVRLTDGASFYTPGGGSAPSHVDDAAFTVGVDDVAPIGALADDTATDNVDEGDVGAVRMTLDRKLLTRVVGATDTNRLDVDASGHAQVDIAAASVNVPVTDAGGSLTVDNTALSVVGGGTEATALRVTVATDSTGVISVDDNGATLSVDDGGGSLTVDGSVTVGSALPAGSNNIGDVDVLSTPDQKTEDAGHTTGDVGSFVLAVRNDGAAARTSTDGDYSPISVDSAGRVGIADLGGSITVDVTGTVTTQGGAASDAPVVGNPNLTGARASNAIPTAVTADGDAVAVWADQNGAVRTTPRTVGSSLSNVAASVSSVTLLAANDARRGAVVVNDSTATLYLKLGSAASTTSYSYRLDPGGQWEMPSSWTYTGLIAGIWSAASGDARVTELTAA